MDTVAMDMIIAMDIVAMDTFTVAMVKYKVVINFKAQIHNALYGPVPIYSAAINKGQC